MVVGFGGVGLPVALRLCGCAQVFVHVAASFSHETPSSSLVRALVSSLILEVPPPFVDEMLHISWMSVSRRQPYLGYSLPLAA